MTTSRRLVALPLMLIALLALLALGGVLLWSTPADAQPVSRILVSNVSQSNNERVDLDGNDHAQLFHTAAKTGGWVLTSLIVVSEDSQGDDFDVEICEAHNSTEFPTSTCTRLSRPSSFAAGSLKFTHSGIHLNANDNYVAVFKQAGNEDVSLDATTSAGEDSTGLSGWSIKDKFDWNDGGTWRQKGGSSNEAILITVNGYEARAKQDATGRPVILASAEGAPYLFADTSGIADGNGLPFTGQAESVIEFTYSYQWIRVDGGSETNIGKQIKVEVSFTDLHNYSETVTSRPFGPITEPDPLPSPSTLVSNTGHSASATATITMQYAMEFTLGDHGQGYEISSVSIDLAVVPSDLTVSLWIGKHSSQSSVPETKLFDFENPSSFAVGMNRFTAPAGVLAYQSVRYYIVLSGFGSSLSINETTSDGEDDGGEAGAELGNKAHLRALNATGRWSGSPGRDNVLRLAVEGSRRASGILASTYAQPFDGDQEIISAGDECCFRMGVGPADRYLIRGFSWLSDDSTPRGGGITNPFNLIEGTSSTGAKQFRVINTRNAAGITEWTAPQGATVEGGSSKTYIFRLDVNFLDHLGSNTRLGGTLTRIWGPPSGSSEDVPPALGVTLSQHGDVEVPYAPYMAVLGEPLNAMVQNLGQADDGYSSVGGTNKVLSQGFTTGSDADGYELLGIGVNIEGSGSNFPDGPTSVSVAVHADSSGQPGAKLFDLVSPTEFAAGHSFFEAPPGTTLEGSTSYVMVWSHLGGTVHRMRKTSSNSEDSGGLTGFSIANVFYQGADLDNMAADSGSDVLEIAVYGPAVNVENATGAPRVLASAEDAGILAVDTSGIGDPDGIPNVGSQESTGILHDFSYRWIRVDGDTESKVGADSARYRRVDADIGKLIKVEVSFFDNIGNSETVTSLPFGPVAEPAGPQGPTTTLVSNTGQSASATANITQRYDMGFKLGTHGQGYEISSVSIDLAAVPSSLTVSLWMGPTFLKAGTVDARGYTKLFDFENPSSFQVGLNRFTAPAGAFAYQNVDYYIVLSDFGSSLSIKETTSDDEDEGGETGATLRDSAGGDSSVLRLAVEGSKRARGILISTYTQVADEQEIVSLGDELGVEITVGAADRYLIRGVTFSIDDTTNSNGGFTNPWELRDGTTELFRMVSTRQIFGINEFTAPQGATVEGSDSYVFFQDMNSVDRMGGVVLGRHSCTSSTAVDSPTATGVTLDGNTGEFACDPPLMAVFGEPLDAMVQNLGQTDNSYVSVGAPGLQVLSQGFTTGSDAFGYRLQGIGINIEGSDNVNGDAQLPGSPRSVSVAVHADSGGKPGAKLFDLVSPTEYAPGHSFFEAPPGTHLPPDTSYVLVWSHRGGHWHRLVRTTGNGEDSGARSGASAADAYYRGVNVGSLSVDSGGNALEFAVYTEVSDKAPFVEGGIPVPLSWFHIPDGAYAGYQFRVLYVTHRGRLPTSGDIEEYNTWVQWEAKQAYSDPIVRSRRVSEDIKAVVCTAAVDARTNTGMTGIGVPVHWLDGGWDDRPTLVASSNAQFYGSTWANTDYGAYVTGNSAHFEDHAMVWTGCDASGVAHPDFPMGATAMDMVAVGTPRGRSLKTREEAADSNFAPLGAVDVDKGYAYRHFIVVIDEGEIDEEELEILLPLYAISPIFTVVGGGHSILPPRNVRGEVDEKTRALTLSWDPPRGYEEADLLYNIWWRNPSSDSAWDPVQIKAARLDPAQYDTGSINRNHGYSETSTGSI